MREAELAYPDMLMRIHSCRAMGRIFGKDRHVGVHSTTSKLGARPVIFVSIFVNDN